MVEMDDRSSLDELSTNSKESSTFSLTFENYVDLQTRLVLLPFNDSDCTGAVISSYKDATPKKNDHISGNASCGNFENCNSLNINKNNDNSGEANIDKHSTDEGESKQLDTNENCVQSKSNSEDDNQEYPEEIGVSKENMNAANDVHLGDPTGNQSLPGNREKEKDSTNVEKSVDIDQKKSALLPDSGDTSDDTSAEIKEKKYHDSISEDASDENIDSFETNQRYSEMTDDSKDKENSVRADKNNLNGELMSCLSDDSVAKNDIKHELSPQEKKDEASSCLRDISIVSTNSQDAPIQSISSNSDADLNDDITEKEPLSPETCKDTDTSSNGQDTSNSSHDDYSSSTCDTGIERSILIRIPGDNVDGVRLMEQDFACILNSIRATPTPIILTFQQIDQIDDSSDESSDETSDEDVRNNKHTNADTGAVIKGRLQRWGSHFAGEAAILSRKAAELAKEKVNEIQQIQNENEMKEAAAAKITDSIIEEPSSSRNIANEISKQRPEICGIFLQTSSGKCIPLREDFYASRKRHNEDGRRTGDKRRAGRNLFRRNPPKLTNTSVLVIRNSESTTCPSLGYAYQWYRSKSVGLNNDGQSIGTRWEKIGGAKSVFFQPSATEVGFKIMCEVSIENPPKEHLSDTDILPLTVECKSPFTVESDTVLFDAALKTFQPMKGKDSHICVSSFDKMVGAEDLAGTPVRLDLHTYRDPETKGRRCFFLKVFRDGGKHLDRIDERIPKVFVESHSDKGTSFCLTYYSETELVDKVLRLKASSRIARESFLLTLGIASFEAPHSALNCQSTLFPWAEKHDESDVESEDITEEVVTKDETDLHRKGSTTPPLQPTSSGTSIDTPVNRKMIAIESELENDVMLIEEKLGSKNKEIINLLQNLSSSEKKFKEKEIENMETKKLLRIAQRRIESLESDLARLKEDQKKHSVTYENQIEEQKISTSEFRKAMKALDNEKSVLSAAVEARDSKLIKMEKLKQDFEKLKEQETESNKLRSQVDDLITKNVALNETITELETGKSNTIEELSNLHQVKEEALSNLEKEKSSASAAKKEFNSLVLQVQNAKGERNRWKQKADSLAKEMSRICRGGSINDIEKLMNGHQELKKEVSLLRSQKKKAEEELEESLNVHASYVQAQELVNSDASSIRAVQKCSELERLVSHMTEYVNAKESQLDSIKAINRALTEELHLIHQSNLEDNDI